MKHSIRQKIVLCFVVLMLHTTYSRAQGGVDVASIPVDSLTSDHIGKSAMINFFSKKTVSSDSILTRGFWVSYLDIHLNNKNVDIIAYNGRGADYWYYDKAYIELQNYKAGLNYRVYDCIIKDFNEDTITFRWTLRPYKKAISEELKPEKLEVVIPKSSIAYILFKS